MYINDYEWFKYVTDINFDYVRALVEFHADDYCPQSDPVNIIKNLAL